MPIEETTELVKMPIVNDAFTMFDGDTLRSMRVIGAFEFEDEWYALAEEAVPEDAGQEPDVLAFHYEEDEYGNASVWDIDDADDHEEIREHGADVFDVELADIVETASDDDSDPDDDDPDDESADDESDDESGDLDEDSDYENDDDAEEDDLADDDSDEDGDDDTGDSDDDSDDDEPEEGDEDDEDVDLEGLL